ncbi:glycoside hydrolase family 2 TIM barrel-domain containing protein [Chitinophaga sp.]|uniref:glycoside hydrolase family 2 TIM barrel-domain containing protein n=1 Tax=Chitinophaga sp. TaxID=1869181 RepID=UPI0031DF8FF7
MRLRHLKYYRIYFSIVALFILVSGIGALAKVWAYFNKGADRSTALNLQQLGNTNFIQDVTWLPSIDFRGRPPADYNRAEIMQAYLGSWVQQEISYLTGDTNRLKDYYTTALLPGIKKGIKGLQEKHILVQQVDLDHHVKMKFFSRDGQIAAFSDDEVKVVRRVYDKKAKRIIASNIETRGYDVVMLLEDDRWKISAIEQKRPVRFQSEDTLKPAFEGMVVVKGRDFMLNGQPFLPHGINYYPQKTPWTDFWPSFDTSTVRKDFSIIRDLGFNVVRVFVNYADFNGGNVNPLRITQLKELLNLAERYQLKVIITLFDFIGDYGLMNYPAMEQQLKLVLTVFRGHKAIMAWDLKNEPDLDYNDWSKKNINDWLEWVAGMAKKLDPNHLVTIGWAHPENATAFASELDFISFHSYRSPSQLEADVITLRKNVTGKPLVLEEYGMPTYRGMWAPFGANETKQANYFREVQKILDRYNIPSLVWTLYDFTHAPEAVVGKLPWRRTPQSHFGILRENGTRKPGADILRR